MNIRRAAASTITIHGCPGCPKCGGEMKIISFIERHQSEVIEKILRHGGLWEETSARAPPAAEALAVG